MILYTIFVVETINNIRSCDIVYCYKPFKAIKCYGNDEGDPTELMI